LAVESLL